MNLPYLRVGTAYYKRVSKPLLSQDNIEILIPWSIDTIKQDHSRNWREVISEIAKYDGFCVIPSHTEYREEIQGFLNRYEPVPHQPKEGGCPVILDFLQHIFGEQAELGLDYLTILYRYPTQVLPILTLVSGERATGKTTFLNLLKEIFGANMTINTNDDFRSQFNSDWATKLIIAIDEVLLDRREDSERIKNLSTAKTFKSEAKGVDKVEVEFFGKFILCSNNEINFVVIDPKEIRYWIRKLNSLPHKDPGLQEKMKAEIPQLLHLLTTRQITAPKVSRMWFSPEQLSTPALKKVKAYFSNRAETELIQLLQEIIESRDLREVCFVNQDAQRLLKNSYAQIRTTQSQVRQILEDSWQLKPKQNAAMYSRYLMIDGTISDPGPHKGRYYSLSKERCDEIIKDLLL